MKTSSFNKWFLSLVVGFLILLSSLFSFVHYQDVAYAEDAPVVITKGTYVFKDYLQYPSELLEFNMSFVSNGIEFDKLYFGFVDGLGYSEVFYSSSATGNIVNVYNPADDWRASNVAYQTIEILSDVSILDLRPEAISLTWFKDNATFVPPESEPEPEPVVGVLNMAYEFFYTWLWGESPNVTFAPYADSITLFIALFFVVLMAYFAFRLVTGLIKLIYYLFDVRK